MGEKGKFPLATVGSWLGATIQKEHKVLRGGLGRRLRLRSVCFPIECATCLLILTPIFYECE